ncbi:MAG: TolB family protein, partial [Terriglobales bacterium]
VVSFVPTQPPRLVLLPTGAGSAVPLRGFPAGVSYGAAWLPNGKALLMIASAGGGAGFRLYRQNLRDDAPVGPPRAISGPVLPELHPPVSPDSQTVLARNARDSKWYLYRTAGGAPRPLAIQLKAGEIPIRWSAHGRRLFVISGMKFPVTAYAISAVTGQRSKLFTIAPQDLAGMMPGFFVSPVITPDGKYYAYSLARYLSALFEAQPSR